MLERARGLSSVSCSSPRTFRKKIQGKYPYLLLKEISEENFFLLRYFQTTVEQIRKTLPNLLSELFSSEKPLGSNYEVRSRESKETVFLFLSARSDSRSRRTYSEIYCFAFARFSADFSEEGLGR